MRTTLDIDDDVLRAAKERAQREHKTAGQMVSELLRRALAAAPEAARVRESSPVYGFEPFAPTGRLVTNGEVDDLRSDDAY